MRGLLQLWIETPGYHPHRDARPLGWSALAAPIELKLLVSTGLHTNFHSCSKHYGMGFLNKSIAAYLREFHNRTLPTLVPTEGPRKELDSNAFRESACRFARRRYAPVLAVAAQPGDAPGLGCGRTWNRSYMRRQDGT